MADEQPVRVTAAGAWFRPPDGGAGSLLRLPAGVPARAVRQVRDLGVPGLLPIGNVVDDAGRVSLRTPQPPGPTVEDLLGPGTGLGTADAVAILGVVLRVLQALHVRGLAHGALDGDAVLLDPAGSPVVVLVAPAGDAAADRLAAAALARLLAHGWCDAPGARLLHEVAHLAATGGSIDALAALPRAPAHPGPARRVVARVWNPPAPRAPADGAGLRRPGPPGGAPP